MVHQRGRRFRSSRSITAMVIDFWGYRGLGRHGLLMPVGIVVVVIHEEKRRAGGGNKAISGS